MGVRRGKVNLIGTLEILGRLPLITAPFSIVKKEAELVLAKTVQNSRSRTRDVEARNALK